jgi:hypothetical protein
METSSPPTGEYGPTLRPRIIDVSEMDYREVASHVDSDTTAHFERKPGRTTLVIH